jgi:hypothetical protein
MPASPPYIPAKDADFNNWLTNFSTLLTASPTTYGLVAADAVIVAGQTTLWTAAYLAAINGLTRGPNSIAVKDAARVTAQAIVRPYAQSIANNVGVLVDDKIAIGVNPRTNPPSPIAAPTTNPVLSIIGATPLVHTLRYRDEMSSPSVKSKPYGVMQVLIFGKASATVISDPTELDYIGAYTKCPLQVTWDAADVNKYAYYAAKWINRNALEGPWSPIVSFSVANGST